MACEFGLHLLPIAVVILAPATFIICYIIAVCLGHVKAAFPYISETGTTVPESCVFAQLLNICAVLTGLMMYVRYKQIAEYNQNEAVTLRHLNNAALVIGLLAAFGTSLVANFQETNVLIVHMIGAVMAFGLGTVYCWIHTRISYLMSPHNVSSMLSHFRAFCACMATLLFVATLSFGVLYVYTNLGYWSRIVSTASEWAMALSLMLFFASFIGEFRRITMSSPQIRLIVRRVPHDPTLSDPTLSDPVV